MQMQQLMAWTGVQAAWKKALRKRQTSNVKIALINAVLTQDGAGAANEGESEASRLWRCGTLRSTELDAAPMLRRAIEVSDER